MKNYKAQLAKLTRTYRAAEKLSQKNLAEKAEVSERTISFIERECYDNITVGVIDKVCRAVGTKLELAFRPLKK